MEQRNWLDGGILESNASELCVGGFGKNRCSPTANCHGTVVWNCFKGIWFLSSFVYVCVCVLRLHTLLHEHVAFGILFRTQILNAADQPTTQHYYIHFFVYISIPFAVAVYQVCSVWHDFSPAAICFLNTIRKYYIFINCPRVSIEFKLCARCTTTSLRHKNTTFLQINYLATCRWIVECIFVRFGVSTRCHFILIWIKVVFVRSFLFHRSRCRRRCRFRLCSKQLKVILFVAIRKSRNEKLSKCMMNTRTSVRFAFISFAFSWLFVVVDNWPGASHSIVINSFEKLPHVT